MRAGCLRTAIALPSAMPTKTSRSAACSAALTVFTVFALAAAAQQGVTTFKHFHQYPTGQWQQTGQGYRNGAPIGQPISSTNCTGPVSAATLAAIKDMGNSAAMQCTTRVLTDTERLVESEQTCAMPGKIQVNRLTMHAVDDKTIATEMHATLGGREIVDMRITVRYQGTCTPEPVGAKPSAEDCAQIAEMKQQAKDGTATCSQVPAAQRAGCEAAVQRGVKQVEQLAAMCR